MVIKKVDAVAQQAAQEMELLQEELVVTQTLLVKLLEKVGAVELSAELLASEVDSDLAIDLDHDEERDVWVVSLKATSE